MFRRLGDVHEDSGFVSGIVSRSMLEGKLRSVPRKCECCDGIFPQVLVGVETVSGTMQYRYWCGNGSHYQPHNYSHGQVDLWCKSMGVTLEDLPVVPCDRGVK